MEREQLARRVQSVRHRRRRIRQLLVLRHGKGAQRHLPVHAAVYVTATHGQIAARANNAGSRTSRRPLQRGYRERGSVRRSVLAGLRPQSRDGKHVWCEARRATRRHRRQRDHRSRGLRRRRTAKSAQRLQLPVAGTELGSVGLRVHTERGVPDDRQERDGRNEPGVRDQCDRSRNQRRHIVDAQQSASRVRTRNR